MNISFDKKGGYLQKWIAVILSVTLIFSFSITSIAIAEENNEVIFDPNDPAYVEPLREAILDELNSLDSDEQFSFTVDVKTVTLSQEYLEELEYNSNMNVFFGYTIDELQELFEGVDYVFTLGENGETDVIPFQKYQQVNFFTYVKGTAGVIVCIIKINRLVTSEKILTFAIRVRAAIEAANALSDVVKATFQTYKRTRDISLALDAGVLCASEILD